MSPSPDGIFIPFIEDGDDRHEDRDGDKYTKHQVFPPLGRPAGVKDAIYVVYFLWYDCQYIGGT